MPRKKPTPRKSAATAPGVGAGRRIVVLSRNPNLYSTRRFAEAARVRGHRLEVVDTLDCAVVVEKAKPAIVVGGHPLSDVDVVVPRIGASITSYGLAVVNQFELMGVPVLNGSASISRSRDKLRCLQLLARYDLDVPRTVLGRAATDVDDAVRRVGGLPAIVKLTQGTQGIGVMIAHTHAELTSILEAMWQLGREVLLQEFIAESKGRDVRVLVVGDHVVGAMRRTARKGEFRSNIHRGGEGEAIDLPEAYQDAAIRAARVVGLDVAGVDLLESDAGPKVMEINSSPGFEGLEAATGLDIAGLIIEHAARVGLVARQPGYPGRPAGFGA
jgi:ribosomal protein S6--L-glutamate ligase